LSARTAIDGLERIRRPLHEPDRLERRGLPGIEMHRNTNPEPEVA
jgi:hypothetical protein